MKTSIELPGELFRALETLAVGRGITVNELIRLAIERELQWPPMQKRPCRRVRFPLLDSKEPGTLNLTNAEVEDLLA